MFNVQKVRDHVDHLEINAPEEFSQVGFTTAFGEIMPWGIVRMNLNKIATTTGRTYRTKLNKDKTAMTIVRIS